MANKNISIEKDLLIEQYKLYVEMADRVSNRRIEANKYFSTILTGLLAGLSFVIEKHTFESSQESFILLTVSITSVATSLLWYINLRSYRMLNSAKFSVIQNLESYLPFACFEQEWKILNNKINKKKHLGFSSIEQILPLCFLFVYFIIFIYSIYNLLN